MPGGPPLSRGALGLVLLAGLLLVAQCALLAVAEWRRYGTVLFVRDGGLSWSRSGPAGQRQGRRIRLQVAAGQAVVLERLGQFSRVLGPGSARLLPGETVFRVISTEPLTISGAVDCSTKDGIPVDVAFEIRAQLQSAGGADIDRTPASARQEDSSRKAHQSAAWSPEAVARAAYEGGNWDGALIGLARAVLRDLTARSYLGELMARAGALDSDRSVGSLAERARVQMVDSARAFGVAVPSLRIVAFRLPPAFAESAMSAWSPLAATGGMATADGNLAPRDARGRLVLAPVISGESFSTLRKAARNAAVSLHTSRAGAAGHVVEVTRLAGCPAAIALRPNASLFAMEVRDGGLADLGAEPGDLVILESGDSLANDRVLAVIADGRPSLRRCWLKADHALLTGASPRTLPIAMVEHETQRGSVAATYADLGIPVDVRASNQVKVIASGLAVLRPIGVSTTSSRLASAVEGPGQASGSEAEM
jgi:regulator of protease activity HflC (stomatin/prohibitin superfamily)